MPQAALRKDVLLFSLLFLASAGLAAYIYWPALTTHELYHPDLRQSPHWAAYHTNSFRADDMLVEYGQFNESPLQNAIYFLGTWLVDPIWLSKILSILGYGLTTCLFFFVGRKMYGERSGLLIALVFAFFPNTFEYSAGFYSKFWMIPLLFLCLYVLRTEKWRGLILLMPFAALAYPMTSVLIGMVCAVHTVLLFFPHRKKALLLLRSLAVGSILAIGLLAVKYVSPPEFVGPKFPREVLIELMASRGSKYVPIPSLAEELIDRLDHPFVIVSSVVYLLLLRRRLRWELSWTSLLVASCIGYVLADLFFFELYIPNRYTRYSMILLLILWHATNWNQLLERIAKTRWRHAALAGMLVVAGVSFSGSVEYGDHITDSGQAYTPLCRFVRTLPEGILVAGPPRILDEIMLRSKRSTLSTFKLNHEWYPRYQFTLRERTLAIYGAIYAADEEKINELHRRFGVTHLVVGKAVYDKKLQPGSLDSRYDPIILEYLIGRRTDYLLQDPPEQSVVYDDGAYTLIELPLPPGS